MPPANDNFADAQLITGASGTVSGDTTDATTEASDPLEAWWGDVLAEQNVWFKWVAPASGSLLFTLTPGTIVEALVAVATGADYASLEVVTATDTYQYLEAFVAAGETYYFEVDGLNPGSEGTFDLAWEIVATPVWADPVVIVSEHHEDNVDIAPSTEHRDTLTALVNGDQGKWLFLASGSSKLRNSSTRIQTWGVLEHLSFLLLPSTHEAQSNLTGTQFDASKDAMCETLQPAYLWDDIAATDGIDAVYGDTFENDIGHRTYLGIVLGGLSRLFYYDLGEQQNNKRRAIATDTAVSVTMTAAQRSFTKASGSYRHDGAMFASVAWDNSSGASFTPDAGWTLAGEHSPPEASYGVAIYYKRFDHNDTDDYTFSGTLSESVAWQAEIAEFALAFADDPGTPVAEDVPAQGICVALENDTHELDQVWTRLDDPDA